MVIETAEGMPNPLSNHDSSQSLCNSGALGRMLSGPGKKMQAAFKRWHQIDSPMIRGARRSRATDAAGQSCMRNTPGALLSPTDRIPVDTSSFRRSQAQATRPLSSSEIDAIVASIGDTSPVRTALRFLA